jgi:hypothetical protein
MDRDRGHPRLADPRPPDRTTPQTQTIGAGRDAMSEMDDLVTEFLVESDDSLDLFDVRAVVETTAATFLTPPSAA